MFSRGTWPSSLMRQLTYVEPGLVRWEDAAAPVLSDQHAVLARPLAVARCDLDLAMAAFGLFPGPYPVGHEAVAEIVAAGDVVSRWRAGDRVLIPFQVCCGQCPACQGGRFAACHRYRARAGSICTGPGSAAPTMKSS